MESLKSEGEFAAAGFTLIEVLVVLAILALSAAVLVPNLFPDEQRIMRREGARLVDTLQHAALTAQWRGENLAWSADGSSYRFWKLDANALEGDSSRPGWRALSDDELLVTHILPAGEHAQLLRLGSQPAGQSWLVFRADGVNEPYAIELGYAAARVLITADPLNRVTLVDVAL